MRTSSAVGFDAWARSSSIQPISEESGVPSWWAVSRAIPTQIVRRSALRIPASPHTPSERSTTMPPPDRYGIQRKRSSTAGSP